MHSLPLQQWRQAFFGTPLNQSNAANDYLPGADDLPNLLRYSLGLGPLDPIDATFVLQPVILDGGLGAGARFPRATAATDLIWEVEQTDSLIAPDWITIWSSMPGTGQQNLFGIESNGEREIITLKTPVPLPESLFLRLRIMER